MKNRIYYHFNFHDDAMRKSFPETAEIKKTVKRAIDAALRHEKVAMSCEVSVTFSDDEAIRELNLRYRGKDSATDVLSFPLFERGFLPTEAPADKNLFVPIGDIVLSLETAQKQAESYGHSFDREIAFLTVHSVLHLVGYDHENSPEEERLMNDACEEVLEKIGLTRDLPYIPPKASENAETNAEAGEPSATSDDAAKNDPETKPASDDQAAPAAKEANDRSAGGEAGDDGASDRVGEKISRDAMRTGFILLLGRPNVGKSTLMNTVLGEKVAIVSKKPQTTRSRITGIYTRGTDQFVFIDTPGVHTPKNKLGEYMMKEVNDSAAGVDAVLFLVEPSEHPSKTERAIASKINAIGAPAILVINKIDACKKSKILLTIDAFKELCDFKSIVPISALENDGVDIVLSELSPFLKNEPWYYEPDAVTDQTLRQMASEVIREKLLRTLDDEIPHGIAVVIEAFEETERLVSIRAEVYCERASHKKIIIGKNGQTLKRAATYAREDLEKLYDKKVYLDIWVKVRENWRDSAQNLGQLGFKNEK